MEILQNRLVVEFKGPGTFSFDLKGVVSAGVVEVMCESGQEGIEPFLIGKIMVELQVVVKGLEQHLNMRSKVLE